MSARPAPECRVNDIVSMERWDATEPPEKRMGPSRVSGLREARCESGWMVAVESLKDGSQMLVDANWIKGEIATSDDSEAETGTKSQEVANSSPQNRT